MKIIVKINNDVETTLVYAEWPSVTKTIELDLSLKQVILKDVL